MEVLKVRKGEILEAETDLEYKIVLVRKRKFPKVKNQLLVLMD